MTGIEGDEFPQYWNERPISQLDLTNEHVVACIQLAGQVALRDRDPDDPMGSELIRRTAEVHAAYGLLRARSDIISFAAAKADLARQQLSR